MGCTHETRNFIFMTEILKNLTDFLLFRREINYWKNALNIYPKRNQKKNIKLLNLFII